MTEQKLIALSFGKKYLRSRLISILAEDAPMDHKTWEEKAA